MKTPLEVWNAQAPGRRMGLIAGVLVILAATIGIGIWAMRTDYQVLFADVAGRDAAAMTAELERLKVPYRLSDGAATILVPREQVHKTRLKLASKDIPLHGAVGFEVFNNADFGMTDFVQKVNYQRAIQGELTRTILAIEEVQSARVHLAVPEQGLFKRSTSRSKASVTLSLKPGKSLATAQVAGIQRLVAASVPDIAAEDVTVIDQHGLALTRRGATESDGHLSAAGNQLDAKQGAEDYLARKINQVLDKAFGPGIATAIVDVSISADQSKVTTEESYPARPGRIDNNSLAAINARDRQLLRPAAVPGIDTATVPLAGPAPAPLPAPGVGPGMNVPLAVRVSPSGVPATSLPDASSSAGRRVEQTVIPAGALRRMTVAVVVRQTLDEAQAERIKAVVGSASGFNLQRGDSIVVYPLAAPGSPEADTRLENVAPHSRINENGTATSAMQAMKEPSSMSFNSVAMDGITAFLKGGFATVMLAVLAVLIVWILNRMFHAWRGKRVLSPQGMTALEREEALRKLQQWMRGDLHSQGAQVPHAPPEILR